MVPCLQCTWGVVDRASFRSVAGMETAQRKTLEHPNLT